MSGVSEFFQPIQKLFCCTEVLDKHFSNWRTDATTATCVAGQFAEIPIVTETIDLLGRAFGSTEDTCALVKAWPLSGGNVTRLAEVFQQVESSEFDTEFFSAASSLTANTVTAVAAGALTAATAMLALL